MKYEADPGKPLQGSLAAVQLQVGHIVEEVKLCILIQQLCHVSILVRKLHNQAPQQADMLLQTPKRLRHDSSLSSC